MSGNNGKTPDPIDAAINATQQPPAVTMMNVEVKIALTGRPALLVVPADSSDGELAEVAGLLLTQVLAMARQNRAKLAGGRIVLPNGVPIPPS